MAFVYSKATFAGIVTSLGNSDAYLQAEQWMNDFKIDYLANRPDYLQACSA